MTTAKVDIKIGALSFAGEGDKEWLAKQLDKLIEYAPALLQLTPQHDSEGTGAAGKGKATHHKAGKSDTLAAFLAAKKAKDQDNTKFLASAAWLQANGKDRLSIAEVTKAMDDNKQGKIKNPTLVLQRYVKKGYCVGSGRNFYVTDEGLESLS
jgi:hypothetical protein